MATGCPRPAQLAIDFDYNREMKVGGAATLLTAVLGGSPAYSQTKFNVLNHAMTHSITAVLPTVVCAGFNAVLFFSGGRCVRSWPLSRPA